MTIELTLPDMTCGHCARTVTSTVQKLDPAATVDIDLGTHLVRVQSSQPAEAIKAALAEEGYPAAA
jgi:copper chaperone